VLSMTGPISAPVVEGTTTSGVSCDALLVRTALLPGLSSQQTFARAPLLF
jgi:hypothetical protein